MHVSLFDRVSYAELAERSVTIEGSVRASACERLGGIVEGSGQLTLRVQVLGDARGARLIGDVGGEVTLSCSRCLGALPWTVARPVDLLVVGDEAVMRTLADEVEAHHAPALVGRPVDVLEEEVLLALPDHPAHAPGACVPPRVPGDVDVATAADEGDRESPRQRPFAALHVLKNPPAPAEDDSE